jgi:hypothetical protein
MFLHFVLVFPPVTLLPDHVQPEQLPEPQRIYTFVAELATEPVTPLTVKPAARYIRNLER